MRALSIVASRIYALFVAKSTSVPGLGVGGWGVKPILAMPGFWQRLTLQPLPLIATIINLESIDIETDAFSFDLIPLFLFLVMR